MMRLNAGPSNGPARDAYIQTGPFEGGEILDHLSTVRPKASICLRRR
jgi:hypothetical protein